MAAPSTSNPTRNSLVVSPLPRFSTVAVKFTVPPSRYSTWPAGSHSMISVTSKSPAVTSGSPMVRSLLFPSDSTTALLASAMALATWVPGVAIQLRFTTVKSPEARPLTVRLPRLTPSTSNRTAKLLRVSPLPQFSTRALIVTRAPSSNVAGFQSISAMSKSEASTTWMFSCRSLLDSSSSEMVPVESARALTTWGPGPAIQFGVICLVSFCSMPVTFWLPTRLPSTSNLTKKSFNVSPTPWLFTDATRDTVPPSTMSSGVQVISVITRSGLAMFGRASISWLLPVRVAMTASLRVTPALSLRTTL